MSWLELLNNLGNNKEIKSLGDGDSNEEKYTMSECLKVID